MNDVLFKIEKGLAYFDGGRGYGAEECMCIINSLVGLINNKTLVSNMPTKIDNVIDYEKILDKRVIEGDESKSTQKLKQWLDNDPEVIAEELRDYDLNK